MAEVYFYAQRTETRQADAAIVLGAAAYGNRPSPVLRERINHAIELYRGGYVDTIIFTGGRGRTSRWSEAEVAARYALAQGIPQEAILLETRSTNTVENLAYAQQVAAGYDLQTFLIVSTPFHMRRAMAIAEDLGLEAYTSPTRTMRWINWYTRSRAFVREVGGYIIYLLDQPAAASNTFSV
ncbi:MAG: YdcF family protein [Chloroflexi bacterium]|nr:YdcF family protein [Chloroflexota bacterium]MCI0580112.1 YdcF family protein [Chloroflexota bacterium]MCI0649312.1 YdcF family protein [Chloroflexota bacterium]MCI0725955.1 YdcF family protein [Chloroflexota bacterium]